MGAAQLPDEIQAAIQAAFDKGMEAGRMKTQRAPQDTYKATMERLKALSILRVKVQADAKLLARMRTDGTEERAAQFRRLQTSNAKLSPGEMLTMLIQELETALIVDRQEIETLEQALTVIQDDLYYLAVSGRYFEDDLTDKEIADRIHCDPSTVRKNRGRLIRRLAVRLYGTQAVE